MHCKQTCLVILGALVQGELYLIDVSQAVDLDHPRALDFLREDSQHVNAFFRRAGIAVLNTRELFDFIVDPNINDANLDEALRELQVKADTRPLGSKDEDETADRVSHPEPQIFPFCPKGLPNFAGIHTRHEIFFSAMVHLSKVWLVQCVALDAAKRRFPLPSGPVLPGDRSADVGPDAGIYTDTHSKGTGRSPGPRARF